MGHTFNCNIISLLVHTNQTVTPQFQNAFPKENGHFWSNLTGRIDSDNLSQSDWTISGRALQVRILKLMCWLIWFNRRRNNAVYCVTPYYYDCVVKSCYGWLQYGVALRYDHSKHSFVFTSANSKNSVQHHAKNGKYFFNSCIKLNI